MSWQMAVVGALGVAQYQQQGAIGKFNQKVQNRNAEVAEQEAQAIEQQLDFDISRFNKDFEKLQGQTVTQALKSGVEFSGSALRILRNNAEEAQIQRNIMTYNSKVAQNKKLEEANFARIQGSMARQQAKLAQIQTLTKTGTSLLTMSGGFGGSSPYGAASSGSFQTSQGRILGGV